MKRPVKILLSIIAVILLLMATIVVIAGVIGMHMQSDQLQSAGLKTNRDYLKEIIDGHTSPEIAATIVAKTKALNWNLPVPLTDANWKAEELRLSNCIENEQKKYLASNDPYLDQIADENSADTLAVKFLAACHVTITPH